MNKVSRAVALSAWVSVVAAASVAQATPPFDQLSATRNGAALDILWYPYPANADAFRVYRYTDLRCASATLLYEGPATSFSDAAAFATPELELYRVAAVVGGVEVAISKPVYKLPLAFSAGSTHPLSMPRHGLATGEAMCTALAADGATIKSVGMYTKGPTGTLIPRVHTCGVPVSEIQIAALQPVLVGTSSPASMILWGGAEPSWNFALLGPEECVSLPYDHAYADIQAIAAELPTATAVQVYDASVGGLVGLQRTTASDTWTGINLSLSGRRETAIYLTLGAAADWEPKTLCGTVCTGPLPRVEPLKAAKDPGNSDVALWWPAQLMSGGGYSIFRLPTPDLIPLSLAQPLHLAVPAPEPSLPVLDPGAVAVTQGDRFYYQVVARCADGTDGAL